MCPECLLQVFPAKLNDDDVYRAAMAKSIVDQTIVASRDANGAVRLGQE